MKSAEDSTGYEDFTGPVDEILQLTQSIYDKRLKISAKDIQFIDAKAHQMKNRIINCMMYKSSDKNTNKNTPSLNTSQTTTSVNYANKWPALPQKNRSTLLVKPESSKKLEKSDVLALECQVSKLITEEQIEATIFSSAPTKMATLSSSSIEGMMSVSYTHLTLPTIRLV